MEHTFEREIAAALQLDAHTTIEKATAKELYVAVSKAAMARLQDRWQMPLSGKRAAYFSAEFLIGRMVEANLLNMGLLSDTRALLEQHGVSTAVFEGIEDAALGNGGLGRLAACFLESAATHAVPLDGYGIRYRFGLFKQYFEDGFQREATDDWTAFGDPWSVRREEERVQVRFADQTVWAVPYDAPVIGYGGNTVNTLRLWQAEALCDFDFEAFNAQKYDKAVRERNKAERISAVLYPNDDTDAGKKLRLKQQYFFSAASLCDILRKFKAQYGGDFTKLPEAYAIQLNDTHPTIAIPELLRLLVEQEGVPFDTALSVVRQVFAYTNHTIMPEALETWSIKLFRAVVPQVYRYVVRLQQALTAELTERGITDLTPYRIIDGERVHMARMAIFATHSTNGVARIHSELLKTRALSAWYAVYPERFQNKTNGITQRRWLALANPRLASAITERIGDRWLTEADALEGLTAYADDGEFLAQLREIRAHNKETLADYIRRHEGVELRRDFLLDVQIKRLHEYKRQLLNAFAVLDTYFEFKEGRLPDFTPTAYLFGAKAAPGYFRAKGIIKFINEIAERVNNDPAVRDAMQVLFVSNYNVSYAEKLIPAADVSEQISTAGTEASGTGNMKFMLNGAVTLGTYDGANIEIVEQAGEENNYIFGARVEELEALREGYNPKAVLNAQPRLKRVVETLVDGTFDDGDTGMFRELYTSLTEGASWHAPDHYFLFRDFEEYCAARARVNRDYRDAEAFARKGLMNIAHAGWFSSDRTICQYAEEIWDV